MKNVKLYARGDFADVFELGDRKVLKAFRRQSFSQKEIKDWSDHDAVIRAHFRAEKRTYERLEHCSDLKIYTPKYYGSIDPHKLIDNVPNCTTIYVKGCGILLEQVPGEAIKTRKLDSDIREKVEAILWRIIYELGAPNVWDSSCFIPGSQAIFTLIDFSALDDSPYVKELLSKGALTKELRIQLETEFTT
jgi:hypothetical protein